MAKNALSKFSYNRSSSQHPPLAKPENFLTDGVTRVCLSWKHDSFRRWIRQLAIARLWTCLNNNLRRFRRARKFLHQLIKVNNYSRSNTVVCCACEISWTHMTIIAEHYRNCDWFNWNYIWYTRRYIFFLSQVSLQSITRCIFNYTKQKKTWSIKDLYVVKKQRNSIAIMDEKCKRKWTRMMSKPYKSVDGQIEAS